MSRKVVVGAQYQGERVCIAEVMVPDDLDPFQAEGLAVIRVAKFLPENFAQALKFLRAEATYS